MIDDLTVLPLEVLIEGKVPTTGEELSCFDLLLCGRKATRMQVAMFEQLLERNPCSQPLRALLTGYYVDIVDDEGASPTNREVEALRGHILWFIEHRPDCHLLEFPSHTLTRQKQPEFYEAAKAFWLRHLQATIPDRAVLANAFRFLFDDDPELAERAALKGQSLAPGELKWAMNLSQLYSLRMVNSGGRSRQELAKKALEQFEIYRRLKDLRDENGISIVFNLGRASLEAGDPDYAEECAQELRGSMKHKMQAHVLLGLIALWHEDFDAALRSLDRAANAYRGSECDPTFALAEDLYLYGETDAVLSFLRTCATKWDDYFSVIPKLIEEIESDGEPAWPFEWDL